LHLKLHCSVNSNVSERIPSAKFSFRFACLPPILLVESGGAANSDSDFIASHISSSAASRSLLGNLILYKLSKSFVLNRQSSTRKTFSFTLKILPVPVSRKKK